MYKVFLKNLKNWNQPQKLSKFCDFTSNCQKTPCFFNISEKYSFLNQTTYVLKNWMLQQSFLNRDSTVLLSTSIQKIQQFPSSM